jgi:hypothetical protein
MACEAPAVDRNEDDSSMVSAMYRARSMPLHPQQINRIL